MRPDYGIDAPGVVRNLALIGGVSLILALVLGEGSGLHWPLLAIGLSLLASTATMLWGSKSGKIAMRDRLVDTLRLSGKERTLDLGCGRGLLLIGIAKQLTTGRSAGVDIWRIADQSGNTRAAAQYNARAERVEEKIELHDADLRQLPFDDDTFDCVVSSWAIHNLPAGDRRQALNEAVRVLKPGGKMLIVDIGSVHGYANTLRLQGMVDVFVSEPNFLFVIPTRRLTARKAPLASTNRNSDATM